MHVSSSTRDLLDKTGEKEYSKNSNYYYFMKLLSCVCGGTGAARGDGDPPVKQVQK